MSFGDRLGLAGVILTFVGIAIAILWPSKRWTGWVSLGMAVIMIFGWVWFERDTFLSWPLQFSKTHPLASSIAVFICVGLTAAVPWFRFVNRPPKVGVKVVPEPPVVPRQSLYFSLTQLPREDSVMFLDIPLGSGESFYRFQMMNSGADALDIQVALDMPALLARAPIIISNSGTENLVVKAAFSGYTRTTPQKGTERISGLSNVVVIEIPRFRQLGVVDVAVVTGQMKERQLIWATAPDGAIYIGVSPLYGRFGALSIKRGTKDVHSFAVEFPAVGRNLIDTAKELRPWSRSVLQPLTQDELIQAGKDGVNIKIDQYFQ